VTPTLAAFAKEALSWLLELTAIALFSIFLIGLAAYSQGIITQ
jgi:hypothetical protein